MFFKRRFLRMILVLLLMFAMFSIVSRTAFNAGWTQGYFTSQQSAGSEDGETAVPHPYAHPGYRGHPGWGFGRTLFGGLSFLAFGLFGFMLLSKLFFFRFRRGLHKGKWQKYAQQHHEHRPPWFDMNDDDEPIMKA